MSNIINFGGGATLTPFKPEGKSYLTFSSPSSFTLAVNDATKHWVGTLEYFASDRTWTVWDGTTTLSSATSGSSNVLYMRGTGNTVITGSGRNYKWVLTGSSIKCIGNIENLLDYATVTAGNHPTMESYCYQNMFRDCRSLTKAPELPATTLVSNCYTNMFYGCTSLTQAPALPATTLRGMCYSAMFRNCTSLTQAPALPATSLASECYSGMFYNCTSLVQAPALPATTLADNCYFGMFRGCTSLTKAPALQATTLADYCYEYMFADCTSLTQAPALPATTLANECYSNMFNGCTSLKLSATQTGEYIQEYRIPTTGTGTTANDALTNMFTNTGGNFLGAPEINTTYYLSTDNMIVRETEVATLNGYVGSMIDNSASNPLNITGATVGQIAKITAVDDSGKPTEWGAVEFPNGLPTSTDSDVGKVLIAGEGGTAGWGNADSDIKLIYSNVLTEAVSSIIINKDPDGNALSLARWKVCLRIPPEFADYSTPIYMYCVDGDSIGFVVADGNIATNDISARNIVIYESFSDHIVRGFFYKYGGEIAKTDCRYYVNGVKSTAINLHTYSADKPFPVGTFVEVYGK